ncbi:unnamed protein product [Rotaria sp. Silwood1]|nr:unnamed protein product [Rotaria sp. Silwood1]
MAGTSKAKSLWNKLITNSHEAINTVRLLRIEQEKLSIAAYEIEHTRLDWERMKVNCVLELDQLEVSLKEPHIDI